MTDTYTTFAALEASESRGVDFDTRLRTALSGWLVVAPHGGGIEPGTSEIALAMAGTDHSFYLFEGRKTSGNETLHMTSTRFDDPVLLGMLQRSGRVISVHGCAGAGQTIFIGGRDDESAAAILESLQRDGIDGRRAQGISLQGADPRNICNRNGAGQGVQLEFSRGLRNILFRDLTRTGRSSPTPLFHHVVQSIRRGMAGRDPSAEI